MPAIKGLTPVPPADKGRRPRPDDLRAGGSGRMGQKGGKAPFGPATEVIRGLLVVASGLTPEQAEAIGAAMRRSRTMSWLVATGTAWKVARKTGLQGMAEKAHAAAFAAAAGNADVREAASFAVLPLVLGRRLDAATTALLRGPWEAGAAQEPLEDPAAVVAD